MTKVNSDRDARPTGEFEVYTLSGKLSAVYSPDGRFQGSINSARLSTLSQAYTDRTDHKAGNFPQALASLLARYKDGHGSSHHTIQHKHCLSAPTGLDNKLTAALSITTELLALPLDFNPNMKSYCAPFEEDVDFNAHRDAFSFMSKGSCFCHPERTQA